MPAKCTDSRYFITNNIKYISNASKHNRISFFPREQLEQALTPEKDYAIIQKFLQNVYSYKVVPIYFHIFLKGTTDLIMCFKAPT